MSRAQRVLSVRSSGRGVTEMLGWKFALLYVIFLDYSTLAQVLELWSLDNGSCEFSLLALFRESYLGLEIRGDN